ncbi:hypothetical protein [uncultured Kordia sp.]|uniref:hypothetical protein n=1 Tax=uncultured Kordia sp. TaxID=507699 RepID=UPI00260B4460|nr:hypothetical protein [uncultured Kordia sp.]
MKKKKLKNLNVNKSTISNLNKNVKGGAAAPNTLYFVCGTGPQTIFTCPTAYCSILSPCDTYNSMNRCKTIEVDSNTIPIC